MPRARSALAMTEAEGICVSLLLQEVPGGGSYGLPQPVTSVTGFAMTHCKECGRRADVGSELSAAGGRGSEVSEWLRSKF